MVYGLFVDMLKFMIKLESRDGRLWKYESIIVCASVTIIAIIGYSVEKLI